MPDTTIIYELEGLSMINSCGGISVNAGPVIPANYNVKWLTVAGPVKSLETVRTNTRTIRYTSSEDERVTKSLEDYQSEFRELRKEFVFDEQWTSLEAEFEYKKFCAAWTAVTEQYETREDVPFEIIPLAYRKEDLPPYTRPCRLVGCKPGEKNFALFEYDPNWFNLCKEIASEFEIDYCGKEPKTGRFWSIPEHSAHNLKFIKVGNSYASGSGSFAAIYTMVGTIEECRTQHEGNLNRLRQKWAEEAAKLDPKPLDKSSAVSLLMSMRFLLELILKIDSKSKSWGDKSAARDKAKELIAKLEAIVGGSE